MVPTVAGALPETAAGKKAGSKKAAAEQKPADNGDELKPALTGVKRGKENATAPKAADDGKAKKAKVDAAKPAAAAGAGRKRKGQASEEAAKETAGQPAADAKPAEPQQAAAAEAELPKAEAAPAPVALPAAKGKGKGKDKASDAGKAVATEAEAVAVKKAEAPVPASEPVAPAAPAPAAEANLAVAKPAATKKGTKTTGKVEQVEPEPEPEAEAAAKQTEAAEEDKMDVSDAASSGGEEDEEEASVDDEADDVEEGSGEAVGESTRYVGSGRRAAQGKKYKEKTAGRLRNSDYVNVKEEALVESEAMAVEQTAPAAGGKAASARRRLLDFCVEDAAGQVLPVERILIAPGPVNVSGAIYPEEGVTSKASGRRVAKPFGPVKDWKITYSAIAAPQVLIRTATALYELSRPAARYRKSYAHLHEMLELAKGVYCALSPDAGGSMTASMDEVVAKLARAKIGRSYGSSRDALLLNGKFILQQLQAMTDQQAAGNNAGNGKGAKKLAFQDTPFATALAAEVSKGPVVANVMSNGIRILDGPATFEAQDSGPAKDAMMEADEEMARKLQAKMAAQEYGRVRGPAPKGVEYIRISAEEIADDYPLPAQYEKEEEETDEMLLFDEEMMDYAPEDLPRRVLHNFSIYNAEGFFSSLELVPMWAGVDHDVEMFASGVVTEDDGDWGTAEPAKGEHAAGQGGAEAGGTGSASGAGTGSGAAAAEAAVPQGMRLFLSQIREWLVECSCDSLAISVRTDVAWYRLAKPASKYLPWFRTVLKAAKVAVHILGLLSAEARASRLSFPDVIKRLAEVPEGDSAHLSKKVDKVERFVVVHGQIILNQFKHFPNKAVQKAAFVSELKHRMEMRKHSKLYMSKGKASKASLVKTRNNNPMRNRVATGLKAKPMPATATVLVKGVWHGYFFGAKKQGEEEEEAAAAAAPVAQEVEEDANDEEEAEGAAEETALAEVASPSKRIAKKAEKKEDKQAAVKAPAGKKAAAKKAPKPKVQLTGSPIETDASSRTLFRTARIGDLEVQLGQVISLRLDAGDSSEDEDEEMEEAGADKGTKADGVAGGRSLGLVMALFKEADGEARVQVHSMVPATETVLGDAGGDWELFASEDLEEYPLADVHGVVDAKHLSRPWQWELRRKHFEEDGAFRKRNEEARAAGQAVQYFYRHLYCPDKGMFRTMPETMVKPSGKFVEAPTKPEALALLPDGQGLVVEGVEYRIGDFMYLDPYTFTKEGYGKAAGKKPKAAKRKGRKSKKDEEDEEDEESSEQEAEEDEDKENEDAAQAPAYARKSGKHKGSNAGLKAFVIAQLTGVTSSSVTGGRASSSAAKPLPSAIKVRRFYRPEDTGREQAYTCEWAEVYAGPDEEASVGSDRIVGKCSVRLSKVPAASQEGSGSRAGAIKAPSMFKNEFWCTGAYDPSNPTAGVTAPPATLRRAAADAAKAEPEAGTSKGSKAAGAKGAKGKAAAAAAEAKSKAPQQSEAEDFVLEEEEEGADSAVALKTMDIFAGCGGLSEGMHQAGVADTRWGIEYDSAAAAAFQRNNVDAKVFCNNCNVLLRAAMEKAGLADECEACEDCMNAAAALSAEDRAALPLPGEVEFIMGGPPCQGYSGMNRFNKSNWSLVQNSMVMSFLSYCEFYRPRYFLLENVRNFVSHNKSFTFRLTLRTLLEMGYQVRFGVLNAGNYGVPQSRKRTIIWAAAPGEQLPDWPSPIHVFHSPQLTINLPGGVQYTAVPNQVGAPLRAVTVKDAIQDLPPIVNGHQDEEMPYSAPAASAYQRFIRGRATVLHDHICKEMNELNLERCRCIPKDQPGADWRVLQEIVKENPDRELYKGQPLVPWCLPNTAARHNGWRGLFGRLDPNGHFPTSTTDPQPMGKVGQVFHPDQDRIVSVRECARSQGFPDHFLFSGNVHNRHRQVGNAVPPPLAAALGRRLKTVLEEKRKKDVAAALAAQMDF